MSKLGDKVLTPEMSIKVTIATFFMMIITIVGGAAFVVNWTSDIKYRVSTAEDHIIILQGEGSDREDMLIENQTSLAEIKTDLKWIRAYMERDE